MYSVELVKLTGANFERTLYKPGLMDNLNASKFSMSPKINMRFVSCFPLSKRQKRLERSKVSNLRSSVAIMDRVIVCLLLFKVNVIADREGKDLSVSWSSCTNYKLAAMIWLFTGFN